MTKSQELMQSITALRKQVQEAQAAGEMDKATALAAQLKEVTAEYKIALAMDNSAVEAFVSSGAHPVMSILNKSDAKKVRNRAFNRVVLNSIMKYSNSASDQEKAFIETYEKLKVTNTVGNGQNGAVNADGGYLVPIEQFQQILEYRRVYQELKPYCTVRAAASRKGTQPTIGYEDGTLTAFDELSEIAQSKLDFGQIQYTTTDYGDIIPVARELLQDIDVDLMGIIGQRFAKKAINTENAQIMAILNGLTKPTTPSTTYKDIQLTLNKTLDPAISLGASIFTNQDGYNYLDELVDIQGRPLLTVSLADPRVYTFKGRPIVVLKNSLMPTDSTTSSGYDLFPFYIGMMSELVYFWDRVGVEVAASDQAGFTANAIYVRAIERFGVTKFDSAAIAPLQIKIANV